jgi:predicted DNA-binding ribbon-helix-helix protein
VIATKTIMASRPFVTSLIQPLRKSWRSFYKSCHAQIRLKARRRNNKKSDDVMAEMKSLVLKRSIVVAGHKTSVSLEGAFWKGLKDVAVGRRMTLSDLVGAIDAESHHGNLSSAIRLFVLEHYRTLALDGDADALGPSVASHVAVDTDAALQRFQSRRLGRPPT